jgi:hypothetical protein
MAEGEQKEQQHLFHAVTGFRVAIPPDRPDLLLFELKTLNADIIRLSMTKESALLFGKQVEKVATNEA